ncbi:MFS transporter [Sinomonas cellulolyticus]|uniref:MFS transporter n=1 Tax=Sinomonas cellulolyticus TaxID=2801916 RepID=UPI0019835B50|nr:MULTISPECIES: MFS transporter [Sinomonas]GHG51361.1 MFS transporter [Sinomonas sp. KCTC 49339]
MIRELRTQDATPANAPSRRRLAFLGVCLVLIGFNLRTAFSSFAAVLTEIRASGSVPEWAISLLTTVPVTLLGVFAPLAPVLARRFGPKRVLLGAMAVLTLGLFIRPSEWGPAGHLPGLILGTALCGAAIALCNVILPSEVKQDFPHRLGLMGGLYTAAIVASAAFGAGFTYPVYQATGSWNAALLFWAFPALAVTLLFVVVAVRARPVRRAAEHGGANVWRSRTAWHVTLYMLFQAMTSFSVFAWLSPILRERGIDGATAGLMVSASIVLQVLGSLFAPVLAARFWDQRAFNVTLAVMTSLGFALSVLGPIELVWVWIALLGLGQGALTAAALTLIMLRTRDARTAVNLSGMMQGVGYGVGSTGTLLVAAIHQATGAFTLAGYAFLAIGVGASVFGYLSGRRRTVGED